MTYQIAQASIVDWARQWAQDGGEPFHAALMDAPYHLTSITERFGADDAAPAKFGKDGAFGRVSKGFMGKTWDGGDVAFQVDTWRAIYDVLYPGAFMFVFGGSRTFHRMAVAIEDSGFVLHSTLCWLFGSGFPKATNISTQIDRAAGVEDERRPERVWTGGQRSAGMMGDNKGTQSRVITSGATPLAQQWDGHRYGLQSIKPAAEFIICAQRPYEGRPVDDIVATGAGALNIEAGRIGTEELTYKSRLAKHMTDSHANEPEDSSYYRPFVNGKPNQDEPTVTSTGRWPSNVCLTHAPDCTPSHCSEGCAVRRLGEQSGERPTGKPTTGSVNTTDQIYGAYEERSTVGGGDAGTAARFFHNSDYWLETLERIHAADPFMYTPKADRFQREAGLVGMEATTVTDGRETPIDNAYQRGETKRLNVHPTVKPLALTHWLASLLLPPDAYAPRRLLIPFSGSGSEMIGAALAGFETIQGVEIMPEYIDIARRRLDFWQDYAGMDYDTAREYAVAKQEQLEREARMDAPLDDLPLFGGGIDG